LNPKKTVFELRLTGLLGFRFLELVWVALRDPKPAIRQVDSSLLFSFTHSHYSFHLHIHTTLFIYTFTLLFSSTHSHYPFHLHIHKSYFDCNMNWMKESYTHCFSLFYDGWIDVDCGWSVG
jgi:hypothetical protein